jgi:hypothetical protein
MQNPSLHYEKLELVTANLRNLQRKYYEKLARKIMEQRSYEFHMNEETDDLFDESKFDHYMEFINSDNVTNATLAKYIVAESFRKHQIAKKVDASLLDTTCLPIGSVSLSKHNLATKEDYTICLLRACIYHIPPRSECIKSRLLMSQTVQ